MNKPRDTLLEGEQFLFSFMNEIPIRDPPPNSSGSVEGILEKKDGVPPPGQEESQLELFDGCKNAPLPTPHLAFFR